MFHSPFVFRAASRLLVGGCIAFASLGSDALLAADGMPNPLPTAVTDATLPAVPSGTPAAGLLDSLEQQVDGLTPTTDRATVDRLESDAQDALRRSTNAMERIRARRVLRRIEQRTGRDVIIHTASPTASTATGADSARSAFATLAQYIPSSTPTLPGEPPCPPLDLTVTPPPAAVYGSPMAAPIAAPMAAAGAATCPPAPRHYVSLDAIGFWVQGEKLPPLVTTSPIGTTQDVAGVLGQPNTTILYGNQTVNGNIRPGARIQGGIWLDPQQIFALEGHYYALVTQDSTFSQTSTFSGGATTDAILARPFFDIAPAVNAQQSQIIAFPNFSIPPDLVNIDGSIQVKDTSRIQSAGGGGRYSLSPYGNPARVSLWGGYRYFSLVESLTISTTQSLGTDPFPFPIPPGSSINRFDQFSTKNTFNGGELGVLTEFGVRRWYFSADGRLALGSMNEQLTINGRTSAVSGGFEASYPGGLLAQPTNIGSTSRNVFTMIPQIDAKLGYQLFQSLRVTVGYNFTFITNVLRPGDQIDTTVNSTQFAGGALVGDARPAATFNDTSMWLQGVTAGVDLRF